MLKILRYLQPYRLSAFLGLFFKFAETVTEVLLPFIMADMITAGVYLGSVQAVLPKAFLMLGIIFVNIVLATLGQMYAARAAVRFGQDLRSEIFKKINTLSYGGLNEFGSATLLNRLISDSAQVQTTVFMTVRVAARAPFLAIGSFVMALLLDTGISSVFLISMPLIAGVLLFVMVKSIPKYENLAKRLDSVGSSVAENYSGSRVIRSFSAQHREIERFGEVTGNYRDSAVSVGRFSALLNPASAFIMQLGIVIILYMGGVRVDSGTLQPAQITAFITYMLQILLAMTVLANLIVLFIKGSASAVRIEEVLSSRSTQEVLSPVDYDSLVKGNTQNDTLDAIDTGKSFADTKTVKSDRTCEADSADGGCYINSLNSQSSDIAHVEFKNVSFAYGQHSETVKDISFSLKRGERLGIIGATGSGKTTLINLLPAFYYATQGQVLLEGRDISEWDLHTLRRRVSIAAQSTVLFKGTVRENIDAGRGLSDEQIIKALSIAQAHFVQRSKDKLDRIVEQGGRNLSGGQRQRLSVARVVAGRPEVLILDDSSSALDYRTEAALMRAIKAQLPGITVITVSQRVFSIKNADRILVLSKGRAAGLGTHDMLLGECEVYRDIYRTQVTEG